MALNDDAKGCWLGCLGWIGLTVLFGFAVYAQQQWNWPLPIVYFGGALAAAWALISYRDRR